MYRCIETGEEFNFEDAIRDYEIRFPNGVTDTEYGRAIIDMNHFWSTYELINLDDEGEIEMESDAKIEPKNETEPIITEEERKYLLSRMENLLEAYGYRYAPFALNKIIDTWAENKCSLIRAFKSHPNYLDGKFMIAFDADYDREIDASQADRFADWIYITAEPEIFPEKLRSELNEERLHDLQYRARFERYIDYVPRCVRLAVDRALRNNGRVVSNETANGVNELIPEVRASEGEKASRMVNRLLKYIGYDKHPDYNREFAKYADSVSPMTIKRHTVLSINPLDYLTMSFGNSWASCHTIDKHNKRGLPDNYSGCYSSGTISYMLDSTSMVLYTVDASYEGNEYWNCDKINRQMFHYGEDKLVQGRLYPQRNDNAGSCLYDQYRKIVQEIISQIFGFPNLWKLSRGTSAACKYIESEGTHYRDYDNFESCTLSVISGSENDKYMIVGHDPICIECGDAHSDEECINCCNFTGCVCADCGRSMDEEDAYEIDGEYYCEGCIVTCDHCGRHYRNHVHLYETRNGYWICDDCYDDYYTTCDCCGEIVRDYDTTWISAECIEVCNGCLEEKFTSCDECGEYIRDEDVVYVGSRCLCESCANEIEDDDEHEDEACAEDESAKELELMAEKAFVNSMAEQVVEYVRDYRLNNIGGNFTALGTTSGMNRVALDDLRRAYESLTGTMSIEPFVNGYVAIANALDNDE